jgi:hypothetical protein
MPPGEAIGGPADVCALPVPVRTSLDVRTVPGSGPADLGPTYELASQN